MTDPVDLTAVRRSLEQWNNADYDDDAIVEAGRTIRHVRPSPMKSRRCGRTERGWIGWNVRRRPLPT